MTVTSAPQRKMTAESRLNSDDGGVTSSDGDIRSRPRLAVSRALRQRQTVDVVDADLISCQPIQEPRPPGDRRGPGQSDAVKLDDVPPVTEAETARPSEVVEQRPRHAEHDVKELRRRLKSQRAQRKCEEEQAQSSSDRDTVETRLDRLSRSPRISITVNQYHNQSIGFISLVGGNWKLAGRFPLAREINSVY